MRGLEDRVVARLDIAKIWTDDSCMQIGSDVFRLRRFCDESQFFIEKNGAVYALVRVVEGQHEFQGGVQGGAEMADERLVMAALSALL